MGYWGVRQYNFYLSYTLFKGTSDLATFEGEGGTQLYPHGV